MTAAEHSSDLLVGKLMAAATEGVRPSLLIEAANVLKSAEASRDAYRDEVEGLRKDRDLAAANAIEASRQLGHEMREVVAQGKRITELSEALEKADALLDRVDDVGLFTEWNDIASEDKWMVVEGVADTYRESRAALAAPKEGE